MADEHDHNRQAVDVFNRHALQYRDKFMDVSLYAPELDLFCDRLPTGAKVLDLACGPGNMSHYLLGRRPDLRISGSDLAPNMVELARNHVPAATFEVRDCRRLSDLAPPIDGIVCAFCLPYLNGNETSQLITDCKRLLNKNGMVYLSFMKGDHRNSGIQRTAGGNELYFYNYSADDLLSLLKKAGFELLLSAEKNSPPNATVKTTDVILVAIRK